MAAFCPPPTRTIERQGGAGGGSCAEAGVEARQAAYGSVRIQEWNAKPCFRCVVQFWQAHLPQGCRRALADQNRRGRADHSLRQAIDERTVGPMLPAAILDRQRVGQDVVIGVM